jgi:hypothetical protein
MRVNFCGVDGERESIPEEGRAVGRAVTTPPLAKSAKDGAPELLVVGEERYRWGGLLFLHGF